MLMPIGLLAKRCLVRTYLIWSFGQRHDLILMMHLTVKNIHLNYYYIAKSWVEYNVVTGFIESSFIVSLINGFHLAKQ